MSIFLAIKVWFRATRLAQWFTLQPERNPHGWCFIDKFDSRFCAGNKLQYTGERGVKPTTRKTNRDEEWKTWIVCKLTDESPPECYLAFDIFDGGRRACLGRIVAPGTLVAFRVSHEGAEAMFVAPDTRENWNGHQAGIVFLDRVHENVLAQKYPEVVRF